MTTTSNLIDILNNNLNNTLTCTYHFENGVSFKVLTRATPINENRFFIMRKMNGQLRTAGFRESEWMKFYDLLSFLVVDEEEEY